MLSVYFLSVSLFIRFNPECVRYTKNLTRIFYKDRWVNLTIGLKNANSENIVVIYKYEDYMGNFWSEDMYTPFPYKDNIYELLNHVTIIKYNAARGPYLNIIYPQTDTNILNLRT